MSFYEFKREDAFRFANFIGIKTRVEREVELNFEICPYCRNRETGNLWKFSINLKTGAFLCMRSKCKKSGNMITLSRDFDFSLGKSVDEYYGTRRKKYREFKTPKNPIKPKSEAVKYLESRGISEKIAEKYEITVQEKMPNILVFPFYDEKGILTYVKYRKTDFDKTRDNNKEWCEPKGKPILFGMKQCTDDKRRLIVTEGQIDSLSVAEAGFDNVVSVPTGKNGTTWYPHCYDWVESFKEVVIFGDHEKNEITLLEMFSLKFKNCIKHVREEDYKDCKDANEILLKYGAAQVKKCIDNAVQVPVRHILKLSEVKKLDLFSIQKLKTGIKQVDTLLYGGLPFGFVHIIAGKRGEGKSTLGSQIIANAIDQGFVCFVYSGELPNGNFKTWLDYQIAGRNHIVENTLITGNKQWFVTNSDQDLIDKWYDENIYIYDNSIIEDDEREDLLNTIEEMILKYNAQVILIDNLMTAIEMDESKGTDYEKQSDFANRLRKLALRYSVLILLVAHRRKTGYMQDINDEVLGSSKITNIAGVILGYDRLNNKDIEKGIGTEEDRKITISKNRLFGKVNFDGYIVNYEEKSKRIYGDGDDLDYEFGWTKDLPEIERNNGFVPVKDTDDTPFT